MYDVQYVHVCAYVHVFFAAKSATRIDTYNYAHICTYMQHTFNISTTYAQHTCKYIRIHALHTRCMLYYAAKGVYMYLHVFDCICMYHCCMLWTMHHGMCMYTCMCVCICMYPVHMTIFAYHFSSFICAKMHVSACIMYVCTFFACIWYVSYSDNLAKSSAPRPGTSRPHSG
jgi:hypothetical protein